MGPLTRAIACIVAGGSLAAVAGQGVYAAEKKKDVYVVPGADKKTLVSERLQGVEGYQLTIDHYTLPPGWVGGWKALSYRPSLRLRPGGFLHDGRAGQGTPYPPGGWSVQRANRDADASAEPECIRAAQGSGHTNDPSRRAADVQGGLKPPWGLASRGASVRAWRC
jgi:hypothetical protein